MTEVLSRPTDVGRLTDAGFPANLAALCALFTRFEGAVDPDLAGAWLRAVPTGAAASDAPAAVALAFLEDPRIRALLPPGPVADAWREVVDQHHRSLAGAPVATEAWAAARRRAIAASDAVAEPAPAAAARLVEAAAWPPTRSRALLTDMFRAWAGALEAADRDRSDWTAEDARAAEAALAGIQSDHAEALSRGETVDFPALFAARDPALEARYRADIGRSQALYVTLAAEGARMATEALAALPTDPFLWLEEIEGDAALAQVEAWNARTSADLREQRGFAEAEARARAILDDDRRIAGPALVGEHVYNFWRDTTHVRGLWRRSPLADYLARAPRWETLIDLDALAATEGRNWVWAGSRICRPETRRALVSLSDGGRDAAVWREFDLDSRTFVEDGFVLPAAKTRLAWEGPDSLLVATDFGPGSLTASGYPREVRRWRRGEALDRAQPLVAAEPQDMMIEPLVLEDVSTRWPLVRLQRTFWTSDLEHLAPDGRRVRAPLPSDATLLAVHQGWLIAKLQSDATLDDGSAAAGSLVAYEVDRLIASGHAPLRRVMDAPPAGAVEGATSCRSALYVVTTHNVSSRLLRLCRDAQTGDWRATPAPTPAAASVALVSSQPQSDLLFYVATGLVSPETLYALDGEGLAYEIAQQPTRMDAERFVVEQRWATSRDGARVPYFLVRPKDVDGPVPTLLYGYGGFRTSLTPGHVGPLAQFWLEDGCAYAIANIRGGGEFGPAWHAAALRDNRQRAFDDFHAVAAALKAEGVASRLAVEGGSNGGLLVGVAYTQRPELYDAIVMAVPLTDMRRYHRLLAGASWVGEYGDPDDPSDWAFISRYSPYHNTRDGVAYPPILITTSTKDDRVHPGHARKMAARISALGGRFDYYENIDGGHGGAADNPQTAYRVALVLSWLRREIGRLPSRL